MTRNIEARVDPFTIEVILDGLYAAAREMFVTLGRTAKSPIIYEVLDYACGIYAADGSLVAQDNGVMGFLGTLYFAVDEVRTKFGESVRPGEMYITNDPWTGNGSHLSDVNLIYPIFLDHETLLGYAVNKAHWTEVGGKYAGSWSANTTEVFQEGLQFPCVRLAQDDRINQSLIDLIAANVRTPDDTLGDLYAQAAALRVGAERVIDLCRKFGLTSYRAAIDTHRRRGEERGRRAMRDLPRGTFEVTDLLENNGVGGEPIQVKLRLTISDDTFTIDVSDNPPPSASSVNGTAVGVAAQSRTIFKVISSPESPVNEGDFAPVRHVAPIGTIFCAPRPAAVSIHWEYKSILSDMVFQALAPRLPNRLTAGHQLSTCATIVSGRQADGEYWLLVEPSLGGWGAAIDADGQQGQHPMGNGETYNVPIEVLEGRYPIRVDNFGFDTDYPAGAGKHRGGLGVVKEYRVLDPRGARVTATFGRHHKPPWGVDGGQEGSPNRVEICDSEGVVRVRTGTLADYQVQKGDRIRFITAIGGGWGDPLERDPHAVAKDVARGYISFRTAREIYRVVIDPLTGHDDRDQTERLRADRTCTTATS